MQVVLIHGMTNSARAFDRLVPLLDDMVVTAADLPGHGARASVPCPPTVEELADDVLAGLTEPSVVVGHSLGGHVATVVAERRPDLVTRLVLFNSPPTPASRRAARRLGEQALRNGLVGRLMWPYLPRFVVRAGLRSGFAPGYPVPEVFVDDLRRIRWLTYLHATSAADRFLADATLHTRVASLEIPVTVVFGMRDARVDPASIDGYRSATTTVVTIDQAGHTPTWETPDQVSAVVRTLR